MNEWWINQFIKRRLNHQYISCYGT